MNPINFCDSKCNKKNQRLFILKQQQQKLIVFYNLIYKNKNEFIEFKS